MSTANQTVLESRVSSLEQFAQCLAAGLENRVEGEVQEPSVKFSPTSLTGILRETPGGALLGRAIVGPEGVAAGLLWVSGMEALLGAAATNPADLSAEDVRTLDQALRACCEETGDEEQPPPIEWSALETVSAEDAHQALQQLGVPERCELARVAVVAGEAEFVFQFLAATSEAAAAEDGAAVEADTDPGLSEETESQPADADAEAQAESVGGEEELLGDAGSGTLDTSDPETSGPATSDVELPDSLGNLRHLLEVRIPLTIRLGTTRMNLEDILRISKGTIVELQQREEDPLEVLANGRVIARGEVVVVDDRFGLRITEIGDAAERLRASR